MAVNIKEINIKINIKKEFVPQQQMITTVLQELTLDNISPQFLEELIYKCKTEVKRENKNINNLKINF